MLANELWESLEKTHLDKSFCQGITNLSDLPDQIEKDKFIIIYRDVTNHSGHWFVALRHTSSFIEVFDSRVCPKEVRNILSNHFKCTIYSNSLPLQPRNTVSCGFYCLLFASNRFYNLGKLFPEFR